MRTLVEKGVYFFFVVVSFMVLWNVTAFLWDSFIPWNYKSDAVFLFAVIPLLVIGAFLSASLLFKIIRKTKNDHSFDRGER
ncbi:hypothetical protein LCM10_05335 [Rossellomorea aquimaris]|uniref:hypothetical protein n=1 Tax=Rossellomorea aquimaris TaxID=189382 RepID=UPI001CD2C1B3|nr:hypothetical protein [Rossellomorea aquimaris]MCA1054402.1 hypothetical protein [Rossellomorea aquimaris]